MFHTVTPQLSASPRFGSASRNGPRVDREAAASSVIPLAIWNPDAVAMPGSGPLPILGLQPVLVGGMALAIIGSRRVTRDFDFVIAKPGDRLQRLVGLFYGRGLELASRMSHEGEVTIDNVRVAVTRLRLDAPASAYFLNPQTGLKIDLLFDFLIAAEELGRHAVRTKIRSCVLQVASAADLLRLKTIARRRRSAPGDSSPTRPASGTVARRTSAQLPRTRRETSAAARCPAARRPSSGLPARFRRSAGRD